MVIKYSLPSRKKIWVPTLSHGQDGTSWLIKGSLGCEDVSSSLQISHAEMYCLISADIPGQYMHSQALRHDSVPRWEEWTLAFMSAWRLLGITTVLALKIRPSWSVNSSRISTVWEKKPKSLTKATESISQASQTGEKWYMPLKTKVTRRRSTLKWLSQRNPWNFKLIVALRLMLFQPRWPQMSH